MSDFKEMIDPTRAEVRAREVAKVGKMMQVELLVKVWVPASVVKHTDTAIEIPLWAIQRALK